MLDTFSTVTLLATPRIGRKTVRFILDTLTFSPATTSELRDAISEAKQQSPNLRLPTVEELEAASRVAEATLRTAEGSGINVITPADKTFPDSLRKIPDAPVILYVKGDVDALSTATAVAVIGTREPTPYGAQAAKRFGTVFAEHGLVVISGLALGCDAAAHEGCLDGKGRAVAVLAHGLDTIYPAANKKLAARILDSGGSLVSEYPPGERAQKSHFVERDRLQSGLSAAVVVVETDVTGGTMHTVRFSRDQGRLLGCLVHPLKLASHPKSQGNQKLLNEGVAVPLQVREDLEEFIARFVPAREAPSSASTPDAGAFGGGVESLPDEKAQALFDVRESSRQEGDALEEESSAPTEEETPSAESIPPSERSEAALEAAPGGSEHEAETPGSAAPPPEAAPGAESEHGGQKSKKKAKKGKGTQLPLL